MAGGGSVRQCGLAHVVRHRKVEESESVPSCYQTAAASRAAVRRRRTASIVNTAAVSETVEIVTRGRNYSVNSGSEM